jgi:hypothetical protein
MRNNGIKGYFKQLRATDVDPEALAAYEKSIAKVVPAISREIRESEQYAAELLISSAAASRVRGSARPKK